MYVLIMNDILNEYHARCHIMCRRVVGNNCKNKAIENVTDLSSKIMLKILKRNWKYSSFNLQTT